MLGGEGEGGGSGLKQKDIKHFLFTLRVGLRVGGEAGWARCSPMVRGIPGRMLGTHDCSERSEPSPRAKRGRRVLRLLTRHTKSYT